MSPNVTKIDANSYDNIRNNLTYCIMCSDRNSDFFGMGNIKIAPLKLQRP